METDAIKKFIQKIPFFSVFNDHELNKLVGREKIFKDCKQGETIFKEGDAGNSIFVILYGEVELIKSPKEKDAPEEPLRRKSSDPGPLHSNLLLVIGEPRLPPHSRPHR